MKIERPGSPPAVEGTAPERPSKSPPASGGAVAGTEKVRLSEMSRNLQKLQAAAGVEPSFDAAKVEAVKAAISAGTFRVNPEAVADKLIASVSELLARRSH